MKTLSGAISAAMLAAMIAFSTASPCLAQSAPTSQPAATPAGMTWQGWLLMLASWAAIISLFIYCLYRTLRRGEGQSASPRDSRSEDKGSAAT
ncbi:MAG: hypothetical protein HZA50_15920 [Planctomycetes bacterium]|nr:hypothetical protein [Planctomycetota bacterium]